MSLIVNRILLRPGKGEYKRLRQKNDVKVVSLVWIDKNVIKIDDIDFRGDREDPDELEYIVYRLSEPDSTKKWWLILVEQGQYSGYEYALVNDLGGTRDNVIEIEGVTAFEDDVESRIHSLMRRGFITRCGTYQVRGGPEGARRKMDEDSDEVYDTEEEDIEEEDTEDQNAESDAESAESDDDDEKSDDDDEKSDDKTEKSDDLTTY